MEDPPPQLPPLLPSLQSKEHREPVVSVSSIHVEENSGVVITNSSLRVLGLDAPENEIVLTVIRKPSYGENFISRTQTIITSCFHKNQKKNILNPTLQQRFR